MDSVVIEFVGDTSKLEPAVNVLEKLGQIDAKTAEAFRKGNAEMAKRIETIKKVESQEQIHLQTIAKLTAAIAKMANTTIEEAQLGIADALAETGVNARELTDAVTKLDKAEGSLKKQLRAMTEELALMETQGKRNTKEYNELVTKAGELKDSIADANDAIKNAGSDTRGLDNLVSLATGAAAGFSVLQGSLALFGDQGEEVQQTLLKVQSALAILNGLQQIQQLQSERRFQSLSALIGVEKVENAQLIINNALTSQSVVVRGLATAAQWALNAAMNANPIGVVILAVAALIGGLSAWANASDDVTEKQKKLNEELINQYEYLGKVNNLLQQPFKDRITGLENELSVINSQRVSKNEILKKEGQLLQAKQALAGFNKGFYGQEIEDLGQINSDLELMQQKLKNLLNEKTKTGDKGFLKRFFTGDRSSDDIQKDIDNAQGKIDLLNTKAETAQKAKDEAAKASADIAAKNAEAEKQALEDSLKSATAFAQARVLVTKEGSRAELNARIEAIAVGLREELSNIDLTQGERLKAINTANKEIKDLNFQFQQAQLQDAKTIADAKVLIQKEGSREELNARLDALKATEVAELFSAKNNAAKKFEIRTKYAKDTADVIKAYNQKIQDDTLNARLAESSSEISRLTIAGADATNMQLLLAKEKQLDRQANIERLAVERSIDTAENKVIRIQAINDKELADKRELEKAKASIEINQNEAYFNALYQLQSNRAQRVLDNDRSSLSQRRKARDAFYTAEFEAIKNASDGDRERLKNHEISQKEFDTRELNRLDQTEALKTKIITDAEKERQQIKQVGYELLGQAVNTVFEIENNNRKASFDAEISRLQEQKDAALNNKNLTEQQKQDIEKRFRAKEKEIKLKAWKADQDAAAKQAIINGLLAFTKALPNFILAGAALLSAGLQVVAIKNQKPPQFKKGGFTGNKHPDEPAGIVHGQEFVVNAEATRRNRPMLEAMNDMKLDEYLSSFIPKTDPEVILKNQTEGYEIDYDVLAEKVGKKIGMIMVKHIPAPVQNQINMDEHGFTKHIINEGNRMTIRNKRYKT